jgi:pSer/pThr/pTyr-binding forkhead associated (FHA) protein
MVVGRLESCDICLADANTSRQHAAFVAEGSGWAIEDLGSTNGTLVNGKPVDHVCLSNGDVVVVGITELVYHEPRS